MSYWRDDNTEGFTAADLAMLNEAQRIVSGLRPGMDQGSIGDRLNNAWVEGITLAELTEWASWIA